MSKMFYFETAQGAFVNQTHALAAMDLCRLAQNSLQAALQQIPVGALASDTDPVRLPARVFLAEDMDYQPLRFTAVTPSGSTLPQWLRVDQDNGQISALRQPEASELPLQVQVELAHSEGPIALAGFTIVADSLAQPLAAWTVPLAQKFGDAKLEKGVRASLSEHLAEAFRCVGLDRSD